MRDRIAGTIPDPEGRSGTGPSTAISETYSILVGWGAARDRRVFYRSTTTMTSERPRRNPIRDLIRGLFRREGNW
jgi:hypothetical protein